MFDKLLDLDKHIFLILNNWGSVPFDSFWLIITKQSSWIPFFILLGYLLQQKIGWKKLGVFIIFIALILLCCNSTVEICKTYFHRLRPCNDLSIRHLIRIVHQSNSFSFFSGHAANSTATMVFIFITLRKYYKYTLTIFLYPLVFAYSRIYLGVHFPADILTGFVVGILFGIAFYKLYEYVDRHYLKIKAVKVHD